MKTSCHGSCGVTTFPRLYTFVHTYLFANVHCSESLVWIEASSFFYIINTGSSPGILLDILLLPCVSWRSCSFGSSESALSATPAVYRWGRYWDGPAQSFEYGHGRLLSWSDCQISCTTRANSLALSCLPSSLSTVPGKVQGQHTLALRSSGLVHPHPYHQIQLYCAAQWRCSLLTQALSLVGGKASPPTLVITGPDFLTAVG